MEFEKIQNIRKDPFNFDLSNFTMPAREKVGADPDRAVSQLHNALQGHKILLLVCGGIAAYKTPGLVRMLRSFGAEVDVRLTANASQFIGAKSLEWATAKGKVLSTNELSGEVEHLAPYSMYLVAPATYNFINGVASGRGDTPAFTVMAAALGRAACGEAKVLILPCMNADMSNPILHENMKRLEQLGVAFVAPRVNRGKLEYPGSEFVTVAAARQLSKSPLRYADILITGGPTPVAIDDVRQITNIFRGKLGLEVAKELCIRGANPKFLLGGSLGVPDYLEKFTQRYRNYDQYKELVLQYGNSETNPQFAVLSSAVADYRPAQIHAGKISSKMDSVSLPPLVPTEKVIDLLHKSNPNLPIISFKLLSRVSEEELIAEARSRLNKHSELVVANRLEDCVGELQTVYLVAKDRSQRISGTKRQVASAIVDAIEDLSLLLKSKNNEE